MKLGIILPTYVYDATRVNLVTHAMNALAKTKKPKDVDTHLWVMIRPPNVGFDYPDVKPLLGRFQLQWTHQPNEISGTEQTLAYGTHYLFEQGMDYVTWMGDDADFHPDWLNKLTQLIKDKPDAKSWSVYRSAHEAFHKTIEENGEYVKVTSICGHGLTMSKEEWKEWGVDWHKGHWPGPYGDTLDLLHIHERPGDRWVTKESWIEHTGKEGVHCTAAIPEHAIAFQTSS
jgi:hypothetical protein